MTYQPTRVVKVAYTEARSTETIKQVEAIQVVIGPHLPALTAKFIDAFNEATDTA